MEPDEEELSIRDDYVGSGCDAQSEMDADNESQYDQQSHRTGTSRVDDEFRPIVTSSPRLLSKASSIKHLGHSFDFHSRTNFDATQNILQSRSDSYLLGRPPPDYDIWKRKPPDFRPQGFAPRPPPRNSKYAMKPWMYSTPKDSYYAERLKQSKEVVLLPDIAKPRVTQSMDKPEFIRRFHIVDSEEARQAFVREGQFPTEPYEPPKPHDFRGYPSIKKLGLDEFLTSYERDPFNIKFHTNHPRTIVGQALGVTERDIDPGPDFAPPLKQPPKWEVELHHPQDPFPNRPRDYTRYRRRNRDVHSAFMDRVDETLTVKWCKEQMERALREQQTPREVKVN
ncbi:uncharacterized protein LOC135500306 [Lineus longissimus]|uniref:uncharacterized protein LOC135500306 n=1 Tax=Lineus longissimus TaxID=88925 RepID=UPI00315D7EFA